MKISNLLIIIIFILVVALLNSYLILNVNNNSLKIEKTPLQQSRAIQANIEVCVDVAPPVLDSIGVLNATEGTEFSYDVNATSPSGNPVYFYDDTSIFDININTGLIKFTPTAGDVGVHAVKIYARHDICPYGLEDYENVTLAIYSYVAPPVTPPSAEGPGGGGFGIECTERWECGLWGDCLPYIYASEYKETVLRLCKEENISQEKCGFNERLCIDVNKCNRDDEKPQTIRACTYYKELIPLPEKPVVIEKCGDKICEITEIFSCLKDCWIMWLIILLTLVLIVILFLKRIKKKRRNR